MSKIVAFVPAQEAAAGTVEWAQFLATRDLDAARSAALAPSAPRPPSAAVETEHQTVTYLCAAPRGGTDTVDAVRSALDGIEAAVIPLPAIESMTAAMEEAHEVRAETLVANLCDLPREYATDFARRLLRRAPCQALVILSGTRAPADVRRILAVVTGSAHDRIVLESARDMAQAHPGSQITLATIEDDVGGGAEGVGERELGMFLREAGVDAEEGIETKVIVDNHPVRGVVRAFDRHDLVIVGAGSLDLVKSLQGALGGASVGVVKRRPPLKRRSLPDWIPQVNPEDYAELAQTLRQGSRWNADFVTMLGLASGIATLGLIQDSPAVVIGSMLLAPLMTPMLGFGLALAQANGRMARLSGRAILQGFLLTLLVSFVLGFLSFRDTLSPEIVSRGSPNILDLGIALMAAAAAAFALARPSIAGAVAGVAIATALVPPVCACGVALARGFFLQAFGSSVLFFTNLLAIVVASALTFMLMGVSVPHTSSRAKRLARHAMVGLTAFLLLLGVPLGWALKTQLDEGRAMPLAYPVTRAVATALLERVAAEEGAEIMLMGQTSVSEGVVVYLACDHKLDQKFRHEIREIVRAQMHDDNVRVYVIVVKSAMDGWTAEEDATTPR